MTTNSDSRQSIVPPAHSVAPSTAGAPEHLQGIALDELPIGAVVDVETGHNTYRLENRGEGKALISGHPMYCPEPVLVDFHGSAGPSTLKMWLIEPGLKMEFQHPTFGIVRTSRIRSVRQMTTSTPS